ncbi:MAG: DUF4011 domain-containing protein [Planctomycetes bacterium]|nr:DUF4011 domain-containing protein [Planctomycetota bacterium]
MQSAPTTLSLVTQSPTSAAFEANGVSCVRSARIEAPQGLGAAKLRIALVGLAAPLAPFEAAIESLPAGGVLSVDLSRFCLPLSLLTGHTERTHVEVEATLVDLQDNPLARATQRIEVLPRTHWYGNAGAWETIAAFVAPNALVVSEFLTDAASRLERRTGSNALDGYQSGSPERVQRIAEACCEALAARISNYASGAVRFDERGQRLRTITEVAAERMGNCVDMACAAAALLERADLHVVLVIGAGHAALGFFVEDEHFAEPYHLGKSRVKNRVDLGEVRILDATIFTGGEGSFAAALEAGEGWLAGLAEDATHIVDLRAARLAGVHPVTESLELRGIGERLVREVHSQAWTPRGPVQVSAATRADRSRPERNLERWMKRLLDLTLRNRLLNDRWDKTGVPLLFEGDDALGALENYLWDERKLQLVACPPLVESQGGEETRAQLKHGWLTTRVPELALYERATKLAREGRSALEETGARSLYVAIGFLQFSVDGRSGTFLAPLMLVPVELERVSRREGYRVVPLREETITNAALAEYMRQVHGVELQLEAELPEDEQGVDVVQFLARVRTAVRDVRGCTVRPLAKLGTWQFRKLPLVHEMRHRGADLIAHPLVSTLLGVPSLDVARRTLPLPKDIEGAMQRRDVRLPLPADSSQLAAIAAAMGDATFVLQGPPGTGKSQTITNLLCESIARGKRVLFLAEKSAALDVVAKRLARAGLGAYALNLHPSEATRTRFLAQVKDGLAILSGRAANGARRFPEKGEALDGACASLARVKELLHDAQEGEVTLHEAIDLAIAARVELGGASPRLDGVLGVPLRRLGLAALAERARTLGLAAEQCSPELAAALQDFRPTRALRDEEVRDGARALGELDGALAQVEQIATGLAQALGAPPPLDVAAANRLAMLARFLCDESAASAGVAGALGASSPAVEFDALERALALEEAAQQARRSLDAAWEFTALSLPLAALQQTLRVAREQFFVFAWFSRRRVRKELIPHARISPAKDGAGLEAAVGALLATKAALDALPPHEQALSKLRGRAERIDVEAARRRLAAAREVYAVLREQDPHLLNAVGSRTANLVGSALVASRLRSLEAPLQALEERRASAARLLALAPESTATAFRDERARIGRWIAKQPDWDIWSAYCVERGLALRLGLEPIAQALEQGRLAPRSAEVATRASALQGWIESRLRRELELGNCSGGRVAELRRALHACMRDYFDGASDAIDCVARDRAKAFFDDDTREHREAVRTLADLKSRQTMRRTIRRVMGETGPALLALKPVVLASPLSAAQFLPPDFPKFDLVVIDEASQVPVWDAACALSRGRHAVVVGDSKQLPPTSFFDARSSEDSEEELEEGEQHESVLDGCSGAGIPELSLLWHYRSRDERLIEFANRRSYGGALQTFPAPARAHPDLGVEFRLVKGVYDRAGTATNELEARAVVEEALRRLRSDADIPANRSIGIVTFSVAQQKLVADLLDLALDADETARKNREKAAQQGEDLFVKNLESVQGDERATMLFSIGYGPDASGRIHHNFGPLGTSGGERRLNVAITRAKEKVVVFSSMRASQLDPARCRARGVQDLRSYLEYAELGVVPSTSSEGGTRREIAVSALERELAEALRARGWQVDTHVGRSRDYRISLALADARAPERWLLGVELDGAHWALAPTTLDREAVRGSVLAALGWTILPVSTLDCWRDLPRVVEALDAAARSARDIRK